MRLIDADAMIASLKEYIDKPMTAGLCATLIEMFPTAYNPEKVVGEIKSSATDNDGLIVKDGNEPMIWKSKAIDIVKRGGVE